MKEPVEKVVEVKAVAPPVPNSFWDYLRSFGPGIIIVLTWFGAGDVVDMAVAGANYGYALMWVLVVKKALAINSRWRVAFSPHRAKCC